MSQPQLEPNVLLHRSSAMGGLVTDVVDLNGVIPQTVLDDLCVGKTCADARRALSQLEATHAPAA